MKIILARTVNYFISEHREAGVRAVAAYMCHLHTELANFDQEDHGCRSPYILKNLISKITEINSLCQAYGFTITCEKKVTYQKDDTTFFGATYTIAPFHQQIPSLSEGHKKVD